MNKWLRRGLISLGVLLLAGAAAYYWLFVSNGAPGDGDYRIDMAAVRAAANEIAGEKAQEVRTETVASRNLPLIAFVAGEGWTPTAVAVLSHQIVLPDRTIIIDTGFDQATAKQLEFGMFDEAGHARVAAALQTASAIVMTHEHMDHIGGLLTNPNLAGLLKTAMVTKEQFDNPERSKPIVWPKGSREGYKPLAYDGIKAIAPGVVLIKAAGHTPGSQMIYVERADGTELLFMGDIASFRKNVDLQRARSRLVGDFFVGEDRGAVLRELRELGRLAHEEPKVHLIPGHDAEAAAQLTAAGVLVKEFK